MRGLVCAWVPGLYPHSAILNDFTANRNNGTLTNMVPTEDYVADGQYAALDFDGVNESVTTTAVGQGIGAIPATKSIAMSVWLRNSDSTTGYRGIWGLSSSTNNNPYWIIGTQNAGRNVILSVRSDTGTASINHTGSRATNSNQWTHIYVSQSNTQTAIYVNGQLDLATGDLTSRTMTLNRLTLGAYFRVSASNFYLGRADDARVYNVVHSPAEIYQMWRDNRHSGLRSRRWRNAFEGVAGGNRRRRILCGDYN
ncbi:MAG: LamG-like jellyroll fold domain-containing protein [Bacteroidota bacterium]